MTPDSRQRLWARIALAAGILLLLLALRYTDWSFVRANAARILPASLAAVAISGAWHIVRTLAWAACFPTPGSIGFARLFRVRIAAEAVSYVTVRGVAGEPLKVILLRREIDAQSATAAVALERLAYIFFTTLLVGAGALLAYLTLPLGERARAVFLAFAAGAAVMAAGAALILRRRPTAHSARPAPISRSVLAKAGVFITAVTARLRLLTRTRGRLLTLLATSAVSFVLMALEAWAIFRIGGMPISFAQALAIETLTRVASVASAFIPANLGALEAASLAAAAAAGAPGGALLAVARRLRGLCWAGVGLFVFPTAGSDGLPIEDERALASRPPRVLLYVAEDDRVEVSPLARLAGLPIAERVVRAARKAGYEQVLIWAPRRTLGRLVQLGAVRLVHTRDEWRSALASVDDEARLTAIGPGTVVSPALLAAGLPVTARTALILEVPAGPSFPVSGVVRVSTALGRDVCLLATVLCERVRHTAPSPSGAQVSDGVAQLALRMPTVASLPAAEETLRRSVYKQTDAKVARFNRRLSLPVSIALMPTPVSANAMSIFVFGLGLLAAWMFSRGEYAAGVLGGVLSLAASILDGCDGEIARLKHQESAFGCWLETVGDYSYYIAIFIGLTLGAVHQTGWAVLGPVGAMGLAGTLLSFLLLIYLRRTITDGRPETLHAVAKARFKAGRSWWTALVWRVSFVATRAAMPYGILALALVNLLPLVVVLSAVGANIYWLSLALKLRELVGVNGSELSPSGAGRLVTPS